MFQNDRSSKKTKTKTDGIHVRQPGTGPGTRGNLSVYLNFSSSLGSEVFPVIPVDCNLTGF